VASWHLYNNELSPWPVTVLWIINPFLIFVGAARKIVSVMPFLVWSVLGFPYERRYESRVVRCHAMKISRRIIGNSCSQKLGAAWRWVVSSTPRSLYTLRMNTGTHWVGGWVGPRVGLGNFGEQKYFLPLPEFEPRIDVAFLRSELVAWMCSFEVYWGLCSPRSP